MLLKDCNQQLPLQISFSGVDPFSHKLSPTCLQVTKIVLLSITIAPLRLFCIFVLLSLCWIIAKIGLLCTSKEQTKKPFTGWRHRLQVLLRKLFRAVFFCMGFHNIKITGEPSTKETAPIIVCAPHATIGSQPLTLLRNWPQGFQLIRFAFIVRKF